MKVFKFFGLILVVPFLLAGCQEDDNIETNIQVRNPAGFLAITVADGQSSAQKPGYFWYNINDNNDTTAQTLSVARVSAPGVPVWRITANDGQDSIDTGVEHGTVPVTANQTANTELALELNIWYVLTIEKVNTALNSSIEFLILP